MKIKKKVKIIRFQHKLIKILFIFIGPKDKNDRIHNPIIKRACVSIQLFFKSIVHPEIF